MKKLILLFALLVCVVAIGDVQGQEESNFHAWCQEHGLLLITRPMVFCEIRTTQEVNEPITISLFEELHIQGVTLTNNSTITLDEGAIYIERGFGTEGNGVLNNSGIINTSSHSYFSISHGALINNGIVIINQAYIDNMGGVVYNGGTIYNMGTIYNNGIFENQGIIYQSPCGNSVIKELVPITGGGDIIDLDNLCVYLPMVSAN